MGNQTNLLTKEEFAALRRRCGIRITRPLVNIRAHQLTDCYFRKRLQPSTGLFYVLPYPNGCWRLFPYRFEDFGCLDHIRLWRGYCVPILVCVWGKELRQPILPLGNRLMRLYRSCPRGRVVQADGGFTVFYGADLPKMAVLNRICRAFGLKVARFQPDNLMRVVGLSVVKYMSDSL